MKLVYTPGFVRAAKKFTKNDLPASESIRSALQLLSRDAFDPRLGSHKLKGRHKDSWSCKAGYDLRIVFRLVDDEGSPAIQLLTVGTHDDVY
jgi:mRNA-degrading endonuclease YafQ of YafQ-DinJ toxin-antitoxin module